MSASGYGCGFRSDVDRLGGSVLGTRSEAGSRMTSVGWEGPWVCF